MSDQIFDVLVWYYGKVLCKGYIIGFCVIVVVKVVVLMVMCQYLIYQVLIVIFFGVILCLNVEFLYVEGQQVVVVICKDGGDDVDVIYGMLIFVWVIFNDSGEISLQGGEGIGMVICKGIGLLIGSLVINCILWYIIEIVVCEVIGFICGVQVEIFVLEGVFCV